MEEGEEGEDGERESFVRGARSVDAKLSGEAGGMRVVVWRWSSEDQVEGAEHALRVQ